MYLSITATVIASLLIIGLGVAVLRSNKKAIVNQTFALFSFIVGLWIVSAMFLKFFPSLLTGSVTISLGVSIGITFFLFSRVYPASKEKPSIKFYAPFLILLVFLLLGGLTKTIITEVNITDEGPVPVFGALYIPMIIYVSLPLVYSLYKLFHTYNNSKSTDRLKMKYLLIAMTGFVGSTFIANGLLPTFGIYSFVDVGPSFAIIWMFVIFFAITRQRLFSIRPIIGKTVQYLLRGLMYFVSFYLIYLVQSKIWGGVLETGALLSGILLAVLFAFLFERTNQRITNFLEKRFFYTKYNPYESINRILKSTSTELSTDKVVAKVLSITQKSLGCSKIGIIIFERANRKVLCKKLIGFEENSNHNIRDLLEIVNFWDYQENYQNKKSEILVHEEAISSIDNRSEEEIKRLGKILKFMEDEDLSVLLPLNRKVQLNGLMIVGSKSNQDAYTVEDINFLEGVVANASVAIGRSLLYRQVQHFSESLQQKVDEQTKELKDKVVKLEEARLRERDMIDIMGHELRTPMSIIKNYFSLLKKFVKSNIREGEKEKPGKYLEAIDENIEREIKLINTLLSATKLDDSSMELNREPVDMIDVIEDGIIGQEEAARRKGLPINFKKPENAERYPLVYADRVRIQEVMDNILNNSVKYTEKGKVTVSIEHDRKFVTVQIKDSGVGMSDEDIKNLGKKFYRVNQYIGVPEEEVSVVRPGGTGLGLYVTFGIVKTHGGQMKVESEVGKGTTFVFTIPIATEEQKQRKKDSGRLSGDMFKKMGLEKENLAEAHDD